MTNEQDFKLQQKPVLMADSVTCWDCIILHLKRLTSHLHMLPLLNRGSMMLLQGCKIPNHSNKLWMTSTQPRWPDWIRTAYRLLSYLSGEIKCVNLRGMLFIKRPLATSLTESPVANFSRALSSFQHCTEASQSPISSNGYQQRPVQTNGKWLTFVLYGKFSNIFTVFISLVRQ